MTNSVRRVQRRVKRLFVPPPPPPYKSPTANRYPNWAQLLYQDRKLWARARRKAQKGPRILIATSVGGHVPSAIVESTLAVALTLRGAQVHFLLCDQVLAACQQAIFAEFPNGEEFVKQGPKRYCGWCFAPAYEVYSSLGVPVHRYSDFLDAEALQCAEEIAETIAWDAIPSFQWNGLAVGEHALAGALRYYARGELEHGAEEEQALRRYLRASLQTTFAVSKLLGTYEFVSACFNHGIYVPQGLIGEVARQKKVRVINWTAGYRKRRFIFTHNETYHHALMTEPTSNWENLQWSPELENDTLDYLKSRWNGARDWIWFHEKPEAELNKIAAELGVNLNRPMIGLLTNVIWDAQLHYPANAFPNMVDWVLMTIRYFAARPELQLVIRIHPAEIRGTVPTRQPMLAEIQKAFSPLPPNVFVIPPESAISTYAIMLQCDSVLIYGTKTGVELTSFGIPVVVAGEAWIRNKGLTLDASSAQDYIALLDRLPLGKRLDDAQRERALKYAYHFFFRRMIPLPMFEPQAGFPFYQLQVNSVQELLPGADRGLDLVCDGILKGTEFVFPAERYLTMDE